MSSKLHLFFYRNYPKQLGLGKQNFRSQEGSSKANLGTCYIMYVLLLLPRSVHPYETPEVLSFPVEDGSLPYLKWVDEAVPDD